MTAQTPAELRNAATRLVKKLIAAGFSAYWVGGCVRDLLLGRQPDDYDIVTSALPEEVEKLFRRTVPVGRKFGVILVIEGPFQFQIATFRAEADYQDGRHPGKVVFGDAKADALRRDFTVNGLLYDPVSATVQDWVDGRADLQSKLIRTIGPAADRFGEDHLRLLRAIRFAAQLDFEIEPATWEAVRTHAAKIQGISAERIRDELLKLFKYPHAARGLELLRSSGLLEHILPEIAATCDCAQSPDYHPEGTVFAHLLLMLRHLPPGHDPLLPWAVLLHDIAKPVTAETEATTGRIRFHAHETIGADMAEVLLERLRFPRKEIDTLVHVVRHHMQFKDAPKMRKSTLRRLLLRPTFRLELELHRLDCLGSNGQLDIHSFLSSAAAELAERPEIIPPLLTGKDLAAIGMQPGPAMGRLLAEIREKQLQDELQTREEALSFAARHLHPS